MFGVGLQLLFVAFHTSMYVLQVKLRLLLDNAIRTDVFLFPV